MSNAPFGRGLPNFENQNTDQEQSNTKNLPNEQWGQAPYDYNEMMYYPPEYAFSGEQKGSPFQGKQNFQNNDFYGFSGGQYYQNENANYQSDYAFSYNQSNYLPEFNSSQALQQKSYNYLNNEYYADKNERVNIDDSKSNKIVNNETNTNENNKQSLNESKNIPLTKNDMPDSHSITPQNYSKFLENPQLPKTTYDISNISSPSSLQFPTTVTTAIPQMLDTTESFSKPPSIEPLPSMPSLPNNTTTGVPKNNQFRRVTKESTNKNVPPISLDILTPTAIREDFNDKHQEDASDSKIFDNEVAQYDNPLMPSTSTKTELFDTKSKDTPSQKEPSFDNIESNSNLTSSKTNNIEKKESKAKSSDEKEETPKVFSTHSPSSYQPLRSSAESLLIHRKIIGREITPSPATTLWDQPPPSSLNSSLHLIPAIDAPTNNLSTPSTSSSKLSDHTLFQDKSLQNTDTGTGSSTLNTKIADSTPLHNPSTLPTLNYCSNEVFNENIDNLANSVKNLNLVLKNTAPDQSTLEEGELKDQGELATNPILKQTAQHKNTNISPQALDLINQSNIEDEGIQTTQLQAKHSNSYHQVHASFQSIEDVVQASKSYPNISNPRCSAFTTVQPSTLRSSNQHPVSQPQIHTIHQPQPMQPPQPQNLPHSLPSPQPKESKYSSDERPESRASSVRSVASSYRQKNREKEDSDREYRERKYREREYRDRDYRRRDDRERSSSRRRYDDRSPGRYEDRSRPSSRNDDYSDNDHYSRSSSRQRYDHPRSRQSSMRRVKDGKDDYQDKENYKKGDDDRRYKDEKRSSHRYRDDRCYEDRDYDRRRDERRYSERRKDDRYYRDDERGYYDRNRERSRSRDPREDRARYPEDQMRRCNRQYDDRYYGSRPYDSRNYYGRSRDSYHSSRRDQYAAPREISEEEWHWRAQEAWNRGEESYRQFYKDYFDYFYNDPQSANLKDPYYDYYKSADKYTRGFYEEMVSYGQAPNVNDQSLPHDVRSSRGSSPGFINLSAADRLARDSQLGSRPSSQLSAYEAFDYKQTSKRLTPYKYPISHVRATFSPSGHLIKVMPFNPEDGQPAYVQVETMNMSEIQGEDDDLVQLKTFPGPLVRNEVHKKDVLDFCKGMSEVVKDDVSSIDVSSAVLLWKFLSLLIKQNGSFIGTDIAELLLDGKNLNEEYSMENPPLKKAKSLSQSSSVANSVHTSVSNVAVDNEEVLPCQDKTLVGDEDSIAPSNTTLNSTQPSISTASITNRFRELLLYGRKKDALDWAVKNHLWGHALFLASKMDAKTYSNIVTRFASSSMKVNDPLQTLYQLMTGKQPLSTSMLDDKWGDWKPHLSMIMSNPTSRSDLDRKSIIILGDTLASRGMLYASHFCYLIGQVAFGNYNKKSSKLILIGSSHSLPFCKFFNNYGVWATEVYEYSMSLADPSYLLTHLVSYKFLYMVKLIDAGLMEEAFKYAEVISQAVVLKPGLYSSTLIRCLQSFSLCLTAWHAHRTPITSELVVEQEPQWCMELRRVVQTIFDGTIEAGDVTDSQGNDSSYGTDWSSKQPQQTFNWSEANFHSQYPANLQQGEQFWSNQDLIGNSSEIRQPISDLQQQYTAYESATTGLMPQNNQPMAVTSNEQQQQYNQYQQQQYNQQAQQQVPHEEYPSFSIGTEVLHKHHQESTPDHHYPPPPLHPMHDPLGRKKSRDRTTSGSSTTSRRSSNSMTSAVNHPLTPPFSSNFASSTLSAADENEESESEAKKRKKQPFPGDEVDDGLNKVIKKVNKQDEKKSSRGGWLSFFKRNKPKEMDLPDDSKPKIVWDAVNKAWVDTENPEASSATKDLAPPPITLPSNQAIDPAKLLPPTENKFSLKQRGARGQYVDVFGGKKAQTADTSALFSTLPKSASMPAKIFTPSAPLSELGNLETTEEHEDGEAAQKEALQPVPDQMPHPQQVPHQPFYQSQQFYQPQQQPSQSQQSLQPQQQQPFQPQQQPFQPQQQPFQPQQPQSLQPQQQLFQPQQQLFQPQQPFQQKPLQLQNPIQQQPQHFYQQPQYPSQNNQPSEAESAAPPVMFDPSQLKGTLHHHSQQPARFGGRRMYPK